MKKIMHLNAFMIHSPMNHTVGSWTHPDSTVGSSFAQPDLWQDIAKTLECGKFDAIFFADQLATYGNYRARTDEALIHAVQFPVHDPVLLVPMLAAVTDKLGFAVTLSATYYPPYMAVRKLSTLDHLTKGRIGWNIVTSVHIGEAHNMGWENMIAHDARYERGIARLTGTHRDTIRRSTSSLGQPVAGCTTPRSATCTSRSSRLTKPGPLFTPSNTGSPMGCPRNEATAICGWRSIRRAKSS